MCVCVYVCVCVRASMSACACVYVWATKIVFVVGCLWEDAKMFFCHADIFLRRGGVRIGMVMPLGYLTDNAPRECEEGDVGLQMSNFEMGWACPLWLLYYKEDYV